jgi:hypothetical protein
MGNKADDIERGCPATTRPFRRTGSGFPSRVYISVAASWIDVRRCRDHILVINSPAVDASTAALAAIVHGSLKIASETSDTETHADPMRDNIGLGNDADPPSSTTASRVFAALGHDSRQLAYRRLPANSRYVQ